MSDYELSSSLELSIFTVSSLWSLLEDIVEAGDFIPLLALLRQSTLNFFLRSRCLLGTLGRLFGRLVFMANSVSLVALMWIRSGGSVDFVNCEGALLVGLPMSDVVHGVIS